jgi:hypothetical protein
MIDCDAIGPGIDGFGSPRFAMADEIGPKECHPNFQMFYVYFASKSAKNEI